MPPEGKEDLRVWTYEKLESLGRKSQKKATERLREEIEAKEKEKGRLAKRLGAAGGGPLDGLLERVHQDG